MRPSRAPFVLAALAVSACGPSQAELDRVRAEADAARREHAAAQAEASARAADAEAARAQLKSLEAEAAALRASVRAASEAAAGKDEAAAAEKKSLEDRLRDVELHRDELRDWIEQELLPVAEGCTPELAALKTATEEMGREVARIRGVAWKHPVMRRFLRRPQLAEWMRREMKRELPEEKARKMVVVGAEFGLVKPGTDLYDVFGEVLESGVAAFYKPQTRTFYLVEGSGDAGSRPIVFHELVHAIEDQHFDLKRYYEEVEDDTDLLDARRAVVEGSADYFQSLYEKEHPDEKQAMEAEQMKLAPQQLRMLQKVPPFLVATMALYPYKSGSTFLRSIGADTPEEYAQLYADPPVSSEQVLHPEKFPLSGPRDYPHRVEAPDLGPVLGQGWEHFESNSMGELTTGFAFAQLELGINPLALQAMADARTGGVGFKSKTKTAIEGWDGDRYAAWIETSSGAPCVVWASVWDSEKDAEEFAAHAAKLFGKLALGKAPSEVPSPVRYATKREGRTTGLDRRGNRVVVVLSAPTAQADALIEAGFAAKVTPDARDANDKAR